MNIIFRITLYALFPAFLSATVWYVHPDSAMNNIDAALDSCAQNDTVLVGPGTYHENIWWPTTKGICLMSEYGPDTTIIDGQQITRTMYIPPDGPDSLALIKGLTIRNGKVTNSQNGGGIYCLRDGFTIEGNTITQNQASFGGGIACFNYQTHLIIKDNTIIENDCYEGAGIFLQLSSATLINNTISFNSGQGIHCRYATIIMRNNTVTDNQYSGIDLLISDATLIDNIISYNLGEGIRLWSGCNAIIDSCTIAYNQSCGIECRQSPLNLQISHSNIFGNTNYAILNHTTTIANAEYNWWGDSTGPYHPDSNPGGLGDTVSDYVDFIPWLDEPVGIQEQPNIVPAEDHHILTATILAGPLLFIHEGNYKIFDITGRQVHTLDPAPGIYFIEVDGEIEQKVIKIR